MVDRSRTPVALVGFAASTVAIAAAYASAFLPGGTPRWGSWLLALGTSASLVSVMALGARRRDRPLGMLRWVFADTFVVMAAGFGLALALPAEAAGSALLLGLPPRAAVLLYGIGLLPLLILPVAYAMTFDRVTLSDDDLARLRAQVAALREGTVTREADG